MADDKSKVGKLDRSRVATSQDYEIEYIARKHGISAEQAKTLVAQYGNDRATLEYEARRLKRL